MEDALEPREERNVELVDLFKLYAETRDIALREQLITAHLGLVTWLARRLVTVDHQLDDLIQVGYIGLIKAIDRFDPRRGNKFSTYAIPTISGEIKRYQRDKAHVIRIPRHLQELRLNIERASQTLAQQLARTPTEEEVAAALEIDVERVRQALSARDLVSLDRELADLSEQEMSSLGALIGQLDEELERTEERTIIRRALQNLTTRQRYILRLLFYEDLSQAEIGELLNISQMQVSRLRRDALHRLRDGIEDGIQNG